MQRSKRQYIIKNTKEIWELLKNELEPAEKRELNRIIQDILKLLEETK